jgi:hypothetical protein
MLFERGPPAQFATRHHLRSGMLMRPVASILRFPPPTFQSSQSLRCRLIHFHPAYSGNPIEPDIKCCNPLYAVIQHDGGMNRIAS